jgi:hypothetical protein
MKNFSLEQLISRLAALVAVGAVLAGVGGCGPQDAAVVTESTAEEGVDVVQGLSVHQQAASVSGKWGSGSAVLVTPGQVEVASVPMSTSGPIAIQYVASVSLNSASVCKLDPAACALSALCFARLYFPSGKSTVSDEVALSLSGATRRSLPYTFISSEIGAHRLVLICSTAPALPGTVGTPTGVTASAKHSLVVLGI